MYAEIAGNKRKTWFIMLFFVAFVAGLSWIIGKAMHKGSITIPIIIAGFGFTLFQYFVADKLAVAVNGAKQIEKKDNPRLWNIVENLAITDGMPMPKVYIMDDPAPNAFATGRDPKHALVCATSGILDIMTDTELQGVFAHEMGHVKNYDIRVSMVAFGLVSAIGLLCDMFLRMSFWGFGGNSDSDDDSEGSSRLFMVLAIVAAVLAPIVATMIQLAVSRSREYLADATGALTTRYPEGLASALEKIQQYGSVLQKQNPSTAHLFFASPLKAKSFANLFSTHPPIEDRIARLREMVKKH